MKRFFTWRPVLVLLLCALLMLPCCAGAEGAADSAVPVKSIAVNEKQTTLLVGAGDQLATGKLTVTVTPENAGWQLLPQMTLWMTPEGHFG